MEWKVALVLFVVSVLATQATSRSVYRKLSKRDCAGHDISSIRVKSAQMCAHLCDKKEGCVGFVHGFASEYRRENCWLKGVCKNPKELKGTNVYLKKAPHVENYKVYPNRDCAGHDIKAYKVKHVKECSAFCEKNPQCVAFDYGFTSSFRDRRHNCWLQSKCADKSKSDNVHVYEKIKNTLTPAEPVDNYKSFPRSDCVGQDIKGFKVPNAKACGDFCNKESRCVAFDYGFASSFRNHRHNCWLQSKCADKSKSDNVHVYEKIKNTLTPVEPVNNYKSFPRSDCVGQDIKGFKVPNAKACGDFCNKESRCVAFDYGFASSFRNHRHNCWLQSKCADKSESDNVHVYEKINDNQVNNYRFIPNSACASHCFKRFKVPNAKACGDVCNKDSRCVAFDYGFSFLFRRHRHNCFLISRCPDTHKGKMKHIHLYEQLKPSK